MPVVIGARLRGSAKVVGLSVFEVEIGMILSLLSIVVMLEEIASGVPTLRFSVFGALRC